MSQGMLRSAGTGIHFNGYYSTLQCLTRRKGSVSKTLLDAMKPVHCTE